MAKIEKRFLSFGLVLALMVALSSVCFAEEFDFSNLKSLWTVTAGATSARPPKTAQQKMVS